MKKYIYLISPNLIKKSFYQDLSKVLSSNKVKYFQLRLKKTQKNKLIFIAKKIKKITEKYGVKLIINDSVDITKIVKAEGCHLGQSDDSVSYVKKN